MTTEEQRELVRCAYNAISDRYRDDLGAPNPSTDEDIARYAVWVDELSTLLSPGARVLDLGCGNGLPTVKLLVDRGLEVVGLDFSTVQIQRACRLVPGATFVTADMTQWTGEPEPFDAIVSFYALIHVPLDDQKHLIPRIADWLRPAGFLLAIVGHQRWTGVEEYLGASMFWDHADWTTYLRWLMEAGLNPLWHRYIPEGGGGHELVLAQREGLHSPHPAKRPGGARGVQFHSSSIALMRTAQDLRCDPRDLAKGALITMAQLNDVRVAVIATEGVEQPELTEPVKALKEAGARVDIISPEGKPIQAFKHHDKGDVIPADRSLAEINAREYDAVLLPGGALNADFMRMVPENQRFLKEMDRDGKPLAVICHAPWELISAGIARGRRMTSYYTIQDDLNNAGVEWVDQEVVVDGNVVSSRKPDDIPAFNREMIELFARVPAGAGV